jgi:hypothetical protein
MIWTIYLIDKRYGTWGLILLTLLMLFFGGGFAPPTFMILAIVTASRINKPVKLSGKLFPSKLLCFLSKLWPFALPVIVIMISIAIVAGIFGYPLLWIFDADTALQFLRTYSLITTFVIGPIVILSAFAHDEHTKGITQRTPLSEE